MCCRRTQMDLPPGGGGLFGLPTDEKTSRNESSQGLVELSTISHGCTPLFVRKYRFTWYHPIPRTFDHLKGPFLGYNEVEMAKTNKVFSDKLTVDLFAGFPVKDYSASLAWYERLLGCLPAFFPNDIEAVWELAEQRYIFIKVLPEHAGHAFNLVFLSDLDSFIAQVTERGLHPTKRETLSNGVRRVIYNDPDGNEVGFGGAPLKS